MRSNFVSCSAFIFVVGAATACESSLAPSDYLPTKGVEVVVDSAVYHLQPATYGWYVNVTASVVNNSDRDVYLSQDCGWWHLDRPNRTDPYLELGAYACFADATTRPAPVLVAAGDRYTQTFKLLGDIQLQANPQILLANNIGPVVFSFGFTDPFVTKSASVASTPFQVLPTQ
jgi:hypothetical protein